MSATPSIKVRRAMPADIAAWPDDLSLPGLVDPCTRARLVAAANDPAILLLAGGQILAAAGLSRTSPGVGEAWFLPRLGWEARLKSVIRILRRQLDLAHRALALHRVHALCRDEARFFGFARLMGLTPEAKLRRLGPDRADYLILITRQTLENGGITP